MVKIAPPLYVAALLTVSLKNVFKVFEPEQIKEISAQAHKNTEMDIDRDPIIGLDIVRTTNNSVKINYSDSSSPRLTSVDVRRLFNSMKNAGIDDALVSFMTVDLHANKDIWQTLFPNRDIQEDKYVATFRNEKCPKQKCQDIRDKNQELIYSSNKQFRYRQLVLSYMIGNGQIGTIHRTKQTPLIELNPMWSRKKEIMPFSADYKLIRFLVSELGEYGSLQEYKLNTKKQWVFVR